MNTSNAYLIDWLRSLPIRRHALTLGRSTPSPAFISIPQDRSHEIHMPAETEIRNNFPPAMSNIINVLDWQRRDDSSNSLRLANLATDIGYLRGQWPTLSSILLMRVFSHG